MGAAPVRLEPDEEDRMKKLAAVLLAAAGAIWAIRRSRADQAEADLWAEATDSVDSAPTR